MHALWQRWNHSLRKGVTLDTRSFPRLAYAKVRSNLNKHNTSFTKFNTMPVEERLNLSYRNLSKPFFERSNEFNRQYCAIYNVRLKQMADILKERISKKWGTQYPVMELHKVPENDFEKGIVIGTLFKDQKLKPSLLKQMLDAKKLEPHSIPVHFTDESDLLFIEDEKQRYQLIGMLVYFLKLPEKYKHLLFLRYGLQKLSNGYYLCIINFRHRQR